MTSRDSSPSLIQSDHHVMWSDHHVMWSDHHVMQSDHHVMWADHHVLWSDHHVMWSDHDVLWCRLEPHSSSEPTDPAIATGVQLPLKGPPGPTADAVTSTPLSPNTGMLPSQNQNPGIAHQASQTRNRKPGITDQESQTRKHKPGITA